MRIPAFCSPLRGISLEEVWHDNDECPVARSIDPADRQPGRGPSLRRCGYCALLDGPTPPASPRQPPSRSASRSRS